MENGAEGLGGEPGKRSCEWKEGESVFERAALVKKKKISNFGGFLFGFFAEARTIRREAR